MGRSKNKKPKQASEAAQSPGPEESDPKLPEIVRAIDGHNTQGWSNNEVKAYNELVHERQKLEKQRHELEEKCAKSQTQRALLHENVANIDSLFKPQKSTSLAFKFTGQSGCCVEIEASASCDHEVCKRAKSEGVSDLELDTIKYYSLRIHTEKSERMRNALRKQRDLELIRVKKEEDDGQVQNARKASKKPKSSYGEVTKPGSRNGLSKDMSRAAKETEKIVNKIIHQLDDLRSDLQTGRISAEEAQGKLNILDTKLPAIQEKSNTKSGSLSGVNELNADDLQETAEIFQSHLRERLLNTKGDTFSQAFSIMDHFLSATKPDDLQAAISELKEVLQLSGPMCTELQNSFGALEGIFDTPDKLSFSGPDGKQECTSMIDLMDKLKETLKRTGQLPDGANASLTKTFQECIDLEAEAKDKMTIRCSDSTISSSEMPAALTKIKNEFVAKSPIPPLTSNKLDIDVTNLLDVYDVRQLLAKAATEPKSTVLEAQITSLVISRTQKKSDKFVEKLQRFDIACKTAGDQAGAVMLGEAIANVMFKMKKWVPTPDVKKDKQIKPVEATASDSSSTQQPIQPKPVDAKSKTINGSLAGASSSSSAEGAPVLRQPESDMRKTLIASVNEKGKFGFWYTFQTHCHKTMFSVHAPLLDKVDSYKEKARAMIEDQAYGMKASICSLFRLKLCPGIVAVIVSQALVDIARTSEEDCRLYLRELSGCLNGLPHPVTSEWSKAFQHIALAMIQLYVAIHIESMAVFPELSALCLALSTVEAFTSFTLMTKTSQASWDNIDQMVSYILTCFARDQSDRVPLLEAPFFHYRHFSFSEKFRCTTTGPCTKHMRFTRMPHNPGLLRANYTAKRTQGRSTEQSYPFEPSPFEPISHTIPDRLPDSDSHVSESVPDTRPMKTIVCYPPGYQTQQQKQDSRTKQRDLQIAQRLKKAEKLYELTAKRALAILQFRLDGYEDRKLLSPNEFLTAMDNLLDVTGSDYDALTRVTYGSGLVTNNSLSKFSEHLDESQRSTHTAIRSALHIQNTFTQLRNGTLVEQYLDSVVQNIVDRALSGQYRNPVEAISIYADSLTKICKIPDCFEDALVKAQDDVENALEDSEAHYACETRRLKCLLGLAGATDPKTPGLLHLATKNPSAFDEYYQIITERFRLTNVKKTIVLELAFSDIVELVQNAQLDGRAASLITFTKLALEDWNLRPEHITKNDTSLLGHENDDLVEDRYDVRTVGYDVSPTIMESPARLPMLQEQSPAARSVANRALVSPQYEIPGSSSTQISNVHYNANTDDSTSILLATAPRSERVSEVDTSENKNSTAEGHSSYMLEDGLTVSSGTDTDASMDKPQYLLSTNQRSSGNGEIGEESNDSSTSDMFRMIDMTKHLTALQRNTKDILDGAEEMTKVSRDHGRQIGQLAKKLAIHVTECSNFIGQIGEWNGVEVAREGYTPSQQRRRQ